ncbi:MAG: ABC transporter permease [Bacteroidota bacterium]
MIRTNFKIGLRSIFQNKNFFILNAVGLVIGLTAFILIGLWVHSEFSYNRALTNYNRVASIMNHNNYGDELRTDDGMPWQLAPVLREEYSTQFKQVVTTTREGEINLKYKDEMLLMEGRFAEPGITHLLDLEMLAGSNDALQDMSAILISESAAKNIFGTEDPMGKTLTINNSIDVVVSGVYKDLSINSSFKDLQYIAPWELLMNRANYEERLGWGNRWFQVFVEIQDENSFAEVSSVIKETMNDNYVSKDAEKDYELFLFPISKWRLYSDFENGANVGGRIELVQVFGIIGIFILLLACINFMNLSTAYSLKRSREVGVRKTLGSSRVQLVFQFFTESFVVILFSFLVALVLVYLLLPQYNTITLKDVSIPFTNPVFWLVCLGLVGVTAIFSSLYPSIYLSGFKPVRVLKGLSKNSKSSVGLRKALIVVQFAISSILIIGTLTVLGQINHAKERPLGFNKDLLVSVPINTDEVRQSFDVIKSELLNSPYIQSVTASDVRITASYTTNGGDFDWRGKDPEFMPEFNTIRATDGFGDMIGWNILEGRDFSADFASDSLAFIANETAIKYMNLENPIGENVRWGKNGTYKIIGIVQDMVTRSPFDADKPALYILHQGRFLSYVNVKIASESTGSVEGALGAMKDVFQKHDPGNIFEYTFMDEEHERKFSSEQRVAKLIGWFSFVAIFISCLGILGLSTYMALQRKKEIGIRKVLGASVQTIWHLLSKQFILLVAIALFIAIPAGYYLSDQYLSSYSYRDSLDFWTFLFAALATLGIALFTVSFQTIKAANANPVNSLRSE